MNHHCGTPFEQAIVPYKGMMLPAARCPKHPEEEPLLTEAAWKAVEEWEGWAKPAETTATHGPDLFWAYVRTDSNYWRKAS